MKFRISFYAVFFLSLLTASQGFSATPSKMDPALAIVSQTGAAPASTRAALKSLSPGQGPFVETLVKFQGGLSGVESLGGHVRSIIGDIATIDIPVGALSQISALPNVIYIESSKRVRRRLDVSVPETGLHF